MADFDDDLPPAPPVRNDSTRQEVLQLDQIVFFFIINFIKKNDDARNFTSFYSTNSSSSTSSSILTASTNTTTCSSSTNSNSSPNIEKPLPKTPDDEDLKKKSKCKIFVTSDKAPNLFKN